MTSVYEIEIKSLLGSEKRADELRNALKTKDPKTCLLSTHNQLNHYFNLPDSLDSLLNSILPLILKEEQKALEQIIEEGEDFSVRTREADGKIIFVIKASMDDGTSANTVSRMEFESEIKGKALDELDQILLDSGLTYQAKWSRKREEYNCVGVNITIDRNAGYGYLAEFEKIVNHKDQIESTKQELIILMNELGIEELPQDRLERMFSHYNKNWIDYYGTDKIFVIE